MSKNIKDIGKELMGKSLNSFHRKTGLTQLEKNNKMQDGILNGILSQVDDAYIEKTEQSNVLHLDGSGDGVVVVDSIEGNTMVNLWDINKNVTLNVDNFDSSSYGIRVVDNWVEVKTNGTSWVTPANKNVAMLKPNSLYTVVFEIRDSTYTSDKKVSVNVDYPYVDSVTGEKLNESCFQTETNIPLVNGIRIFKFTTRENLNGCKYSLRTQFQPNVTGEGSCKFRVIMLEGDWTNKELSTYFKGLQSSFEEKVNDQGKYEIEILSNNKNLINNNESYKSSYSSWIPNISSLNNVVKTDTYNATFENRGVGFLVKNLKPNTQYTLSIPSLLTNNKLGYALYDNENNINNWNYHIQGQGNISTNKIAFTTPNIKTVAVVGVYGDYDILNNNGASDGTVTIGNYRKLQLEVGNKNTEFNLQKQNKIKLLINEPLRAIDDLKDRLCIKDSKLVVERNLMEVVLDDKKRYGNYSYNNTNTDPIVPFSHLLDTPLVNGIQKVMCNQLPYNSDAIHWRNVVGIASFRQDNQGHNTLRFGMHKNTLGITDALENISYDSQLISYLKDNPLKVIVKRAEPVYEEVLNEYGEPIIMEGYENGTIYIDSTIVPTTTVRYTPKMESFKTYKEVKVRNAINDFDVTENVIPYMMEVDMKLTELEMSAISTYNIKNIRKMEVLDMTSMQERTFKMLERLIRGKSHTKQELIDRVLLYEQAKRITTEQALELNLIIEEVYGA